jgi:hypothetical protein
MVVLSALPDYQVRARSTDDSPSAYQMTATGNVADAPDSDDSDDDAPKPKTTVVSPTAPTVPVTTNNVSAPLAATNTTPTKATPAKPATDYAKKWKLKGVVGTGGQATAMIGVNGRTYTFGVSEKLKVDTGNGKVDVSLDAAAQTYVLLTVDGERIMLSLQ